MTPLAHLLTAALLAGVFALFGLLVAYSERWLGPPPFTFLVMLLGLAAPVATVPAWSGTVVPSLSWGTAVVVPVLFALAPLYQVIMGPRPAITAAVLPLVTVLGVGAWGLSAGVLSTLQGPTLGQGTLLGLVGHGASLAGGLLLTGFFLSWIARQAQGAWFVPAYVASVSVGMLVVLAGVQALPLLGTPAPGTPTMLGAMAAIGIAVLCSLIAGAYAWGQLSTLAPGVRGELLARHGPRPLLEEYRSVDHRFKNALRENQEAVATYRRLADNDTDGTYIATTRGRIQYANTALASLLGQPGERLEGVNACYLFGQGNGQGARLVDYPVDPGVHRVWVELPNGHKRPVEVRVTATEDGLVHGRVRDLTEDLLRRRIAHQKEEISRQKERAEFYVDLLRHDIGNYVMAPLTFLGSILAREDLDARVRERLEMAETNLDEIAGLLERIDVLSNVDDLQAQPTDAGELMTCVGERFAIKHPEVDLEVDLPERPVMVQGSPLLEEVFVNLLGNARKHAGEGCRITLRATPAEDDGWILRVDDDGPGIPDERKAAVFDRFEHDESVHGKGLGLYIVRTVVEALGGEVCVADRVPGDPGRGASFQVKLQAAGEEAPAGDLVEGLDEPGTAAAVG